MRSFLILTSLSALLFCIIGFSFSANAGNADKRPRARDVGLVVGTLQTGKYNAITDVKGVLVGHSTIIKEPNIHTGVTAIIPAPGNLYKNPIPAWIHAGNGYGKSVGLSQLLEFGEIETPILLTCTLCVWSAADAMVDYLLEQPGEGEHTINPIVGETNDSILSDMWQHPVKAKHVREALQSAKSGAVAEGSIGAGTGTQTYHWKGGIGTSSRVLPNSLGGYTVGVLVQSNLLAGATLTMNGAPVGRELGKYAYKNELEQDLKNNEKVRGGSIMIVVATDAPLDSRNLNRLATRAMMGLARTGSVAENDSGDYVIAFSTADSVRRVRSNDKPWPTQSLLPSSMSPLFTATVDATEEAIYNALFAATTVEGRGNRLEALPIDKTVKILKKYNVLNWDKTLPPGNTAK
ncbi:MAG: S58 family peptidase [Gammaproteobacteria bacterium]|nr:MAG: S58 family peptidase [Gammaproteobacteria bacterium]